MKCKGIIPRRTFRQLGAGLLALALVPATAPAQSPTSLAPATTAARSSATDATGAVPPTTDTPPVRLNLPSASEDMNLAANPRAMSGLFYSGLLQQALGLSPDLPVKVGGIVDFGGNWLASGGLKPKSVTGDFVLGLGVDIDMARLINSPGAEFYAGFLEYQGGMSNQQAGSVQLYDNLGVQTEFSRQELYELWWRQKLFGDKLIIKIGKINATGEFNQVLISAPIPQANLGEWTISDLLYAPSGLNPTLFGRLPSYPNPAWGAIISVLPSNAFYASYGIFDGNGARGVQTGIRVWPDFNAYKFQIGEVGYAWRLADEGKPGRFGAGVWGQTGTLSTGNLSFEHGVVNGVVTEKGATGFYAFASQRLWYLNPGADPRGLVGFLQFGYTNSQATSVTRYVGGGLTALGLVPGRPGDSAGVGLAWSTLNPGAYAGSIFFPDVPANYTATTLRQSELMLQTNYQLNLISGKLAVQAAYTAIPTPGYRPNIPWANIFTLRLVVVL